MCKILAKSIVQSRSAKNKFHIACSQINSVMMSMQHQLSTIRIAGTIQQSTEVMKSMQQLMKVFTILLLLYCVWRSSASTLYLTPYIVEFEPFEPVAWKTAKSVLNCRCKPRGNPQYTRGNMQKFWLRHKNFA